MRQTEWIFPPEKVGKRESESREMNEVARGKQNVGSWLGRGSLLEVLVLLEQKDQEPLEMSRACI